VNTIPPVQNTNTIRIADFLRINTGSTIYRFSTAPVSFVNPSVDAEPFNGVGQLVKIGDAQRDIKSTANETTITFIGIDTALLGYVLGNTVKGSYIQMWHGFFDANNQLLTTGGLGGFYQFFSGYLSSFSLSEQWMEEARGYVGVLTISASATQLILQNRYAGRYTNNNSWQFYNPTDTSMNRVSVIETLTFEFGKNAPANS